MSSTQTTPDYSQIGQRIADLLLMKFDKEKLVLTARGNKSAEGLGRSVFAVIGEVMESDLSHIIQLNAELLEALKGIVEEMESEWRKPEETYRQKVFGKFMQTDLFKNAKAAIQKATH